MIHEVFPSDLDLSERLIREGRSDEEILSALVRRGVRAEVGAELIQDLRLDARNVRLRPGWETGSAVAQTARVSAPVAGLALAPDPSGQETVQTGGEPAWSAGDPVGAVVPPTTAGPARDPVYLRILEVLAVFYMLHYSGAIRDVLYCIEHRNIPADYNFDVWVYWFVRQAVALGFLCTILYRKRHAWKGPAKVGGSSLAAALELCMVLFVVFGGSIVWSFDVVSSNLPLPEPEVTAGRLALGVVLKFVSKAWDLALLGYVLHRSSRTFASIGLRWTVQDVALALPLGLAQMLVCEVFRPFIYWVSQPATAAHSTGLDASWHLFGPTILLATVCELFLNGFFEEVIVRGFLMSEILRLTRSGTLAVSASVVVQVSYHFYQGVPAGLGHIGWCLVFSLFFLKTRRLLPLALAHNFVNFQILLSYAAWLGHGY